MSKGKASAVKFSSIQVLCPDIRFKGMDAKMYICRDIRQVADRYFFLVKVLSERRGIVIGFVRSVITCFYSHCDIEVLEPQRAFIGKPVTGKDQWQVHRRIPDSFLEINIRMPIPAPAYPECFLSRHS